MSSCQIKSPQKEFAHSKPIIVVDNDFLYKNEITQLFHKLFTSEQCAEPFYGDNTYWTPSKEWIDNQAIPYFRKFMSDQEITKWDKRFDCDDFARTFVTLTHLNYFHFKKEKDFEGVAVAEVWYRPDPKYSLDDTKYEDHAIIVFVLNNQTLLFIDPQNCLEQHLTKFELEHIRLVKF